LEGVPEREGISTAEDESSCYQNLISDDLTFLYPLLRKFPKCYWLWNYRLWLLEQANRLLPAATARQYWVMELALVGKMLTLDSRNFHGWGYRRTIVAALESPALSPSDSVDMIEEEFKYTTKMIETNLSNFSAWHNRSKLIPRLLNSRQSTPDARKDFLDAEIEIITRALYTDPYDQSIWYYHNWLLASVTSSDPSVSFTPSLDTEERVRYVDEGLENVREILDGAEDCKYIYEALITYVIDLQTLKGEQRSVATEKELKGWIVELRNIDKLRSGRWDDLEVDLIGTNP
jgi:geranylgeranyl transferase type-2 subunit alpha